MLGSIVEVVTFAATNFGTQLFAVTEECQSGLMERS